MCVLYGILNRNKAKTSPVWARYMQRHVHHLLIQTKMESKVLIKLLWCECQFGTIPAYYTYKVTRRPEKFKTVPN